LRGGADVTEKKMLVMICGLVVVFVAAFLVFLTVLASSGIFDVQPTQPVIFRYMRSEFFVYEAPDFFAERSRAHRPQMVQVVEESGDWLHVSFSSNIGWVYLSSEVYELVRPMGAFYSKEDEAYTKLVGPGLVEVLAEEDDWILVSVEDGAPLWVNLNFWPPIDVLTDFFAGFPRPVSVFYKNLDIGFTFGHRDDVVYASASLNKAPHALYVYHLAENGLTDLSRTHVITPSNLRPGTGVIRNMPLGTVFTENELLIHSVRDSDNTAFHILVTTYNNHSLTYHQFYRDIGGNSALVRNITGHQMTAAEAGFIMQQIFAYIEGDGIYADEFKNSLLNSDVPIIVADYPVAQKYGRWDGNFHDAAIVYACSPYILVIMSSLDQDGQGAFEEFAEISMFIQNFNNTYFRTQ